MSGNLHLGALLQNSTNNHLDHNAIDGNDDGVVLTDAISNHLNNNEANGNVNDGIRLQASDSGANTNHNHLDHNTTNGNGVHGIFIAGGTGNDIDGNTAFSNGSVLTPGSVDLNDANAGCDKNKWHGNHFSSRNQSCIH